jgi:hypothetical protein
VLPTVKECPELLARLGPPPRNNNEDENIWGLLFGALFSLHEAERMLTKLAPSLPRGFSEEMYYAYLRDFRGDLSEWRNLSSVVTWLSGYYLNSARLRTAFGFENTLAKFFIEKKRGPNIVDKLLLVKGFAATVKSKHPDFYNLVARLGDEFTPKAMSAGKDELEELVETKSAQGALTPELSLLFIWRRVNEFKHRSFNISLPPTKSQFDADCTIHRCALSIAVDLWVQVRQITA